MTWPKPRRYRRSAQQKRLAVFLDGTWNAVGDDTNVWRLKSLCAPTDTDGTLQLAYYEKGVSGLLGGVFGQGVDQIITDAYQWLVDHYDPGDDIFIFGFSRGAYTARSLAGFIAKCGLLKAGGALGVKQLYNRYRRNEAKTIWALLMRARTAHWRRHARRAVDAQIFHGRPYQTCRRMGHGRRPGRTMVHLRGLSLVDAALHDHRTAAANRHGFHAMAVDEHRRAFLPTLWTVRQSTSGSRRPSPATAVQRRATMVCRRARQCRWRIRKRYPAANSAALDHEKSIASRSGIPK